MSSLPWLLCYFSHKKALPMVGLSHLAERTVGKSLPPYMSLGFLPVSQGHSAILNHRIWFFIHFGNYEAPSLLFADEKPMAKRNKVPKVIQPVCGRARARILSSDPKPMLGPLLPDNGCHWNPIPLRKQFSSLKWKVDLPASLNKCFVSEAEEIMLLALEQLWLWESRRMT